MSKPDFAAINSYCYKRTKIWPHFSVNFNRKLQLIIGRGLCCRCCVAGSAVGYSTSSLQSSLLHREKSLFNRILREYQIIPSSQTLSPRCHEVPPPLRGPRVGLQQLCSQGIAELWVIRVVSTHAWGRAAVEAKPKFTQELMAISNLNAFCSEWDMHPSPCLFRSSRYSNSSFVVLKTQLKTPSAGGVGAALCVWELWCW